MTSLGRSKAKLLLVPILAVAVARLYVWGTRTFADDVFIFHRYIDNFLGGFGLVWNVGGEHVEGYTSFLYLASLIPFRLAGVAAFDATLFANGVFYLGFLVSCYVLACREAPGRSAALAALVPLFLSINFLVGPWDGMETTLFELLVSVALVGLMTLEGRLRIVVSGIAFGLAILTRPEGVLLTLVCLAYVTASATESMRRSLVDALKICGVVAVVAVPHLLWRRHFYDDWLPNTYYAKVGELTTQRLASGLGGFRASMLDLTGLQVFVSALLWCFVRRSRLGDLVMLLMVSWIAYAIYLGVPRWSDWHTGPIDTFAALGFGLGLVRLRESRLTLLDSKGDVWALLAFLAFCFGWFAIATEVRRPILDAHLAGMVLRASLFAGPAALLVVHLRGNRESALEHGAFALLLVSNLGANAVEIVKGPPAHTPVQVFVEVGTELARVSRPDDVVAVGACGAIPYYSRLTTIDTLGLNDRFIARQRDPASARSRVLAFGHERGDGKYVFEKRPDFLIAQPFLTPTPDPNPGFEKTFVELFALPGFAAEYRFCPIRIGPRKFVNLHVRSDRLRAGASTLNCESGMRQPPRVGPFGGPNIPAGLTP